MYKHHPHVHMVAVSRFVHWKKLPKYCEQLMEQGLGRINLEAPRNARNVSNYISKYLAKEGLRHRTFGIMRKVDKLNEDVDVNMKILLHYQEMKKLHGIGLRMLKQ